MLRIRDLEFYTQDSDKEIGIIPDADLYDDETGRTIAVGKSIPKELDKELADACGVSIRIIKMEIYDIVVYNKDKEGDF